MIDGYEAFCLYNSLKLHFSSDSYDFHKYAGKSRVTIDSFEKRKDKWHFYKLSRKFTNKDELISFLVANFVNDSSVWIGTLLDEEAMMRFRDRQKVLQSLSYTFENDCETIFGNYKEDPNTVLKVVDGEYPILLKKVLQKDIEIESIVILNNILKFLPKWKQSISDTIRWPEFYRKIIKYTNFVAHNDVKYKLILKKVLE